MSILSKLKGMFGKPTEPVEAQDRQEDATAVSTEDAREQASEEAQKREIALLEKLATYQIIDRQEMTRSVLIMHAYRFAMPLSGDDMHTLTSGLRWIGFRVYGFNVLLEGSEVPCESWTMFLRLLSESEPEGASLSGSFGGVHVTCTMSSEGTVHFSHDASRGISLEPFEELFSPEEISDEETDE